MQIRKSMQIRKPVVPTNFFKKCLSIFMGKMSLPQTVYFTISNFLYKLTQPNIHTKTPELCPHHFKQSTLARVSVAEPNYFSSAPAPDFFFSSSYKKKIIYFYTLLQVGSTSTIYYTKVCTVYNEKWTSLNHFVFHLPKTGAGADPKKSALAPDQILNWLRLQPKNLGSNRLCNTEI